MNLPSGDSQVYLTEAYFMELKFCKSYKSDYVDKEKLLTKLQNYSDWSLKNKIFSKMLPLGFCFVFN